MKTRKTAGKAKSKARTTGTRKAATKPKAPTTTKKAPATSKATSATKPVASDKYRQPGAPWWKAYI